MGKERKALSNLRQRKHPHKHIAEGIHGEEKVLKQISRIEEEIEAHRKRSEVRKLSRSKTRLFRSSSQKHVRLSAPFQCSRDPQYPPQRTSHTGLFFRCELSRCPSPSIRSSPVPRLPRRIDSKSFKDEIVQQMETITDKLKEREGRRTRKGGSAILSFDCELSASARKPEFEEIARRRATRKLEPQEVQQLVSTVERRASIRLQKPSHPNPSFSSFQHIYRMTS